MLDTKKLNRILDIDKTSLTVTAETGIIMQHLEWALQREGLATMHEPASTGCATLGGFLAHRGTGVLSTIPRWVWIWEEWKSCTPPSTSID